MKITQDAFWVKLFKSHQESWQPAAETFYLSLWMCILIVSPFISAFFEI